MRIRAMIQAAQVEFLVRAVHLVVVEAKPHQQRVQAQNTPQAFDHGDRSATADSHRRAAIFLGREPAAPDLDERVAGRHLEAGRQTEQRDLGVQPGRAYCAATQARNKAFSMRAGSCPATRRKEILAPASAAITVLAPSPWVAAPDAVDIGRRPRPDADPARRVPPRPPATTARSRPGSRASSKPRAHAIRLPARAKYRPPRHRSRAVAPGPRRIVQAAPADG